ncbi:type II toxin-antitoxin system RelB/DinJ family antitoxin [Testudinibacter aquarius]|uniref:DNA-damage-inducible protein J n=1 Tax=Testudinibacter aquarius TaxID=1524974 RepID=A0A4R3Y505_9PAST|nr:type II toxin-antitoxin system RelB/DinJ family antitoxin [Testudinibacter aquarius]KAE9529206.1 damage-inducible protein J [Testudinibacter aquarius]TCV87325.1 DNA-damage-inducible protein J [Testudinibacter aquarius]TNG92864.1 type II toxin-antitoxin system RelB/DinJ family antitoxin [Testudinibacter aquarius]
MDASVTIRVDSRIKKQAQENAKKLGIDLSTAIRMLLKQLAATQRLPEGLLQPNEETLQAIYELENQINTATFSTVDELKRDLGW